MGGCCAEFCNNSSAKGYVMKIFPRDPQRRELWTKNVNRKDWTPTINSAFCEMHFAQEMWEKRADGKPKLKPNAVPTIFGFFLKKKMPTAESQNNESSITNNGVNDNVTDTNESINSKDQDIKIEIITSTSEPSSTTDLENNEDRKQCELGNNDTKDNVTGNDTSNTELINKTYQSVECKVITNTSDSSSTTILSKNADKKQSKEEHLVQKQYLELIRMRRKMKALRSKLYAMQTKINNYKDMVALSKIFNEDQIRALFTKKRSVRNWSPETLQRAMHLKLICGTNGYKELLRQKYPFPSLRTLRRKYEEFKNSKSLELQVECPNNS